MLELEINMRFFTPVIWLLLLLPISGSAQAETSITHQLRLPLGAVFEMIVDHDIPDPTYNWSFSKENTFLQAGRSEVFRVRLVQNGSYFLNAEVRNSTNTESYKKRFHILVTESAPIPQKSGPADSLLVTTVPARDAENRLVLHGNVEILQLIPRKGEEKVLRLDLNDAVDSDGDGDKTNDQNVATTFFSTKHSPLHIWLTKPEEAKSFTLGIEGEAETESIALLTAVQAKKMERAKQKEQAEEKKKEKENDELMMTSFGSGTVKFHVALEEKDYKTAPLLLHWKFGDGTQSMLDAPLHTYTKNGVYSVSVDVHNLRSGEIVDTLLNIARVTDAPKNVPKKDEDPKKDGAGTTDEEKDEDKKEEGSLLSLGTILKFGLGILVSILFGFLIVMIIKFLRRKSGGLAQTLEKAETKLVKPEEDKDKSSDEPAPMALPDTEEEKSDVIDVPAPTEEPPAPAPEPEPAPESEAAPAPEPPVAEQSDAPSWLQDGMDQASAQGQTMTSPPPPTLDEPSLPETPQPTETTPPPTTEEAPAPAAEADAQPAPPVQDAEAPAWLDQPVAEQPAAVEPPPPAPEPAPTPVTDENGPAWLQESAPTPEPEAPPAPPVQDADAPAWLQQGMDQAAATGQTPTSPPPAELQDAAPPAPEPIVEPAPVPEAPVPPVAPVAEPTPTTGESIPQEVWNEMSPEEKEKIKKRQKRKRYRQNKKARMREERDQAPQETPQEIPQPEQTETDTSAPTPAVEPQPVEPADDDVKFVVGADSISEQSDPIPPEQPEDNAEHK